jgi:hypothetical protein
LQPLLNQNETTSLSSPSIKIPFALAAGSDEQLAAQLGGPLMRVVGAIMAGSDGMFWRRLVLMRKVARLLHSAVHRQAA